MADNTGTEIFWIVVVRYGDFNFVTLIISDKVHSDYNILLLVDCSFIIKLVSIHFLIEKNINLI